MRWLMIILVFYASHGMSQEHYVLYIDINNTGQFAWQIEEHGKDFILAVQTRCFDSENSCGGIISVDKDGNIIDNALFEGFSGNFNTLLKKNDTIYISGEYNMGFASSFTIIMASDDFHKIDELSVSSGSLKHYNYFTTFTAHFKGDIIIGGSSFAINNCPQLGHIFKINKFKVTNSIDFSFVDIGYTIVSSGFFTKKGITLYIRYKSQSQEDSIRIVRLDTAFNQTFEWSMEVNDNAIPRGCVTRNEDMIITIPDEGLGNRRDLWAIDTTGQVKWKWKWPENSGRTNILRVKEAENGDLLVMGQILSRSIFNDLRYIAFVMRLNPDGEQKWIRYFKIADPDTRLSNYVSDLAELDNGDLQLTGQSRRIIFDADIGEYRPDQDIFWARIGGDGCINGDCSEVYTITDTQDPQVEAAIPLTIFPNPIDSDVLHVETTIRGMVDLYSQVGQQVYSTTLDAGRHTIPMAGLTAGVYVVRLRTMEGKVYSEKVVRI